ncbi:uroporphyrinogen-III synthase [Candidatus Rariloculus sp.]|uniref:uroporphyrinogen-III synthase n=1 Tax=Candidatus Rariloculus sp. TaxID=3101265 RepID=UPI003D11A988
MSQSEAANRRPVVALPETRQLNVLAELLERSGASVVRCPMVAIRDAPDAESVMAWIRRFIDIPMDLFIIYTGEGIERLVKFAEREDLKDDFVAALARTRKLARGPKPGRALRKLNLKPEILASAPTTDGVIETLNTLTLEGARVGVQLYGRDPNNALMDYLSPRSGTVDCVAPYVYASQIDDAQVTGLIGRMRAGEIDAIAFTSKSQVERLRNLARRSGLEQVLDTALAEMTVAAIGPVVADQLREASVRVDVMPQKAYFMKPLVTELARALELTPD